MNAAEPLVGGRRTPADLLLRDVHVLDPRAGIDASHDVRIRAGKIVELGSPVRCKASLRSHRMAPSRTAAWRS